ncbi:hypothetical protein J437_LFUL006074 [Ladona fulva]|uniref:RNA-binding region-containing protein 3 n=1 Tax=Ladona fulva TaxID=123851 RepID=A0A8K0JZG6_LADFU|nr:hypothetical protein J437_LFUL006074 [Ladona fulva]
MRIKMTNGKDTLVIRHLSNELTENEKEQLLRHFGATQVQCIGSKHKKSNIVFAKFPSPAVTALALKRLHQLDVLGYPLTVEYARGKGCSDESSKSTNPSAEEDTKDVIRKKHREFLLKLNSWHHSIQPARPPPNHLRYEYPSANKDILTNICRTLASVPKFYTQVLHLMNKMNLPCPFGQLFPGPEIFVTTKPSDTTSAEILEMEVEDEEDKMNLELEESEESEIEIDTESQMYKNDIIPNIPHKRRKAQCLSLSKRKRAFVPNPIIKSTTIKAPLNPEEVFERESQVPSQQKKIELHLASISTSAKEENLENVNQTTTEELPGFGVIEPVKSSNIDESTDDKDETENVDGAVISLKELKSNRISTKDQAVLPVFKNYQPGAPSCRLYIKNIAKPATARDFHYIYRSFLDLNDEEQIKMFDIRLMQDGRMKGQAFITFPTIAQAQAALKETNGYILKNKPLVVQFARSAKPK